MTNEEKSFQENLSKKTNEQLCEIIVANRYLGALKEEAISCMEELAKRRSAGDQFIYEEYINKLLDSLPKFDLDIKKIMEKMPRIF